MISIKFSGSLGQDFQPDLVLSYIIHLNETAMNTLIYTQTKDEIIKEVAFELGFPDKIVLSQRIVAAVLHALRSMLTRQESCELIGHLPFGLKALYIEGWKYEQKSHKIKTEADFVREVIKNDWPFGHDDFSTAKDGENATKAVFKVLRNHISEKQIQAVIFALPSELESLWEVNPH